MSPSRAESATGLPAVSASMEAMRMRRTWRECMVVFWMLAEMSRSCLKATKCMRCVWGGRRVMQSGRVGLWC
jgi:hypothetical protein